MIRIFFLFPEKSTSEPLSIALHKSVNSSRPNWAVVRKDDVNLPNTGNVSTSCACYSTHWHFSWHCEGPSGFVIIHSKRSKVTDNHRHSLNTKRASAHSVTAVSIIRGLPQPENIMQKHQNFFHSRDKPHSRNFYSSILL